MGIPMPPTAERFERLEDTLRLAHRMFAGDDSTFEGTHLHAERPLNVYMPECVWESIQHRDEAVGCIVGCHDARSRLGGWITPEARGWTDVQVHVRKRVMNPH